MKLVNWTSAAALSIVMGIGGATGAGAYDIAKVAALPKGDPVRKLVILHWQEVLLERIVKGVCYVDAGVEVERNKQIVFASRDVFERTLPDIVDEVKNLDPKSPLAKSLKRSIDKKQKHWFRFRVFFEKELKDHAPEDSVLGQVALMEQGLVKTVERVYKAVRREAIKKGDVTLADTLQEQSGFSRVFMAETMIKEACMVSLGEGGSMEREKLREAVFTFEKVLNADEKSIVAPKDVKALIPQWRELIPALYAMADGKPAAPGILEKLDELEHKWATASGEPEIGVGQS